MKLIHSMPKLNESHYHQKLAEIEARNLTAKQRLTALLMSIFMWGLLYLLVTKVQFIWVPYVIQIQKLSTTMSGYLTYFFAALFIIVWLLLLYLTFQQALNFMVRCFSGVKEKPKKPP